MTEPEIEGPYDPEMKAAGQLTSATWELELFLSGALVFSTFQLPGVIETLFRRLEPHVTETTSLVLFDAALYGKAIAFTLILTFSVHLVARAYWVAMLGLSSVFPKGIRWDEMKVGPTTREVFQQRVPSLNQVIGRLDNFCSIVFSAGLLVAVMFVYSTFLAATAGSLAYLLAAAFTGGRHVMAFLVGVGAVFVIIATSGALIDKKFGERLVPGSRAYRIVRRMVVTAFSISMMRVTAPMMWTLATNVGRKRMTAFLVIALTFLILLSAADRLAQSDRLSINSSDFTGASREHAVSHEYYENQRVEGNTYSRTPSIQSDIIRDPYVKLFIPYIPARHNAAIPKRCPGVKPLQERGLQIGAERPVDDSLTVPVLNCVAGIHAVTLNGAPVPNLRLGFYEHPRTGVEGFVSYIPVDSLARGRHVIGVMGVPPAELPTDSARLANAVWRKPHLIAFWR